MKNAIMLAALAATSIWTSAAQAQGQKLILGHGFPPAHAVATQGFQPFMACVQDATKNAISFDYFPGGQVANFNNALDTVNNGLTHLSGVIVAIASSKLPLNGIAMLPGMGDSSLELVQTYRKVLSEGGPLAEEFRANKVRPIIVNLLPPFQAMANGPKIDTLDKFRGKKMRVSGGTMNFMANALGSIPVEVNAEMYNALQNGTVNGLYLAVSSVKSFKVNEIIKSLSKNGSFGSGITALSMDEATFQKLAPDHQKAITDCGLKVEIELAKTLDAGDAALKDEFAKAGIDVYEFSAQEKAAIKAKLATVSTDFVTRLKARGLPAQEAYDAYRKALGR